MPTSALQVARTGLEAQDARMRVIANNLANVGTTGFKRDRANFATLAYQDARVAGQLLRISVARGLPVSLTCRLSNAKTMPSSMSRGGDPGSAVCSRRTPSSRAPERSAPPIFAERRSQPRRFVPQSDALVKSAWTRRAPIP